MDAAWCRRGSPESRQPGERSRRCGSTRLRRPTQSALAVKGAGWCCSSTRIRSAGVHPPVWFDGWVTPRAATRVYAADQVEQAGSPAFAEYLVAPRFGRIVPERQRISRSHDGVDSGVSQERWSTDPPVIARREAETDADTWQHSSFVAWTASACGRLSDASDLVGTAVVDSRRRPHRARRRQHIHATLECSGAEIILVLSVQSPTTLRSGRVDADSSGSP